MSVFQVYHNDRKRGVYCHTLLFAQHIIAELKKEAVEGDTWFVHEVGTSNRLFQHPSPFKREE